MYPWLTDALKMYAKEQESLFKEALQFWENHIEQAKQQFQAGNAKEKSLFKSEEGTGYIPRNVIIIAQHEMEEAQKAFISRLVQHYEKEHGKLNTFTTLNVYTYEEPHTFYFAKEVFTWIEKQRSGEAVKEALKRVMVGKTISVEGKKIIIKGYFGWDRSEYDDDRLYCHTRGEELLHALSFFEKGTLPMDEAFKHLKYEIDHMDREGLKKKWVLEGTSNIQSFKFFLNGKTELEFATGQDAQLFFQDYLWTPTVASLPL